MSAIVHTEVEVLIVGAGPVGVSLGCLLGRYGVSTMIVDKTVAISRAPRAIALDNEALRILQMVGLADDAFDKMPIPQVRMRCPYVGEFARFNTSGSIDGHPKLSTFYQPDLEEALRALLREQPSVRMMLGVELTDFVDSGDEVKAVLRKHDGSHEHVRARYLVGADGAGSKVRKAIGQEFSGRSYPQDWLIVDARNVPGNHDHVEFVCDPRRPTPHMPAPGGRIRWEFMLQPGETRAQMEDDASVRRLLAPWVDASSIEIERKAVYRFHARSCERYSVGRVFLAGDAAHITPPFIGQGLVSGLRDAANLGWKLAWTLRGHAGPAVLASYDLERRPHAAQMIALAQNMGRMVMPSNAPAAVVLHGAMRLLGALPGARSFLEDLGAKPKNRFRRGLFVRGRGRLPRGGELTQAAVRTSSGAELRSDDALGPAITMVGFGCDPQAQLDPGQGAAWLARGGRFACFVRPGECAASGVDSFEQLEPSGSLGPSRRDWCAVVRPDHHILHDGPVREASRLVREVMTLLDAPASDMHAR